VRLERFVKLKKTNYLIENATRNLPACIIEHSFTTEKSRDRSVGTATGTGWTTDGSDFQSR
jgi:hypothetical protein